MRYFLGVARFENVHRASKELNVSPGSLSKAISRLEAELQVNLFQRVGRGIQLTNAGKELQKHASKIVALEEDTKMQLSSVSKDLQIDILAEEILQAKYGVDLAKKLKKNIPASNIHFMLAQEKKVIQRVLEGDAHLGLISGDVPKGLTSKLLDQVEFKTCVGKNHPLAKRKRSIIPIDEILEYDFAIPSFTMLGKLNTDVSLDGWRDDKFPRKKTFKACGLKVLEELIHSGMAIAYLPEYFIDSIDAITLKVSGCPYKCQQKIKLIARKPVELSWLREIF